MVLNIAMDGPVGAGKSSIADAVAKRLGILHLDTGAMYRAIGLTALEKGVPVQDEQAVTALCQALSMTVGHAADGQHTLVDGRDVTGFIRTPEVSMAASTVAKYAGVRAAMVALQRRLAQETPMLVDGRDIGTRVLMNAPVKIFLTASAEERARRRYQEMVNKGMDANFDDVLRDLRARDEQDTHRAVDPLRAAEDAVTVDSTNLTFDEVVEAILRIVADKTGGAQAGVSRISRKSRRKSRKRRISSTEWRFRAKRASSIRLRAGFSGFISICSALCTARAGRS